MDAKLLYPYYKWTKKKGVIKIRLIDRDEKLTMAAALVMVAALALGIYAAVKVNAISLFFFGLSLLAAMFVFQDFFRSMVFRLSSNERKLVKQVGNLLLNNRLCLQDGKMIVDAVSAEIHITDENICVKFFSKGNKHTDRIAELDAEVQSATGLELIDKRQTLISTDYILRSRLPTRLVYSSDTDLEMPTDGVPIAEGITWKLDKNPHAIIAGCTGSGKTFFLFHLIYCFLRKGASVTIIDPKRSDLYSLIGLKYFSQESVAASVGEALKMLRLAVEMMQSRYTIMGERLQIGGSYVDFRMVPHVIFFDEIAAFLAACDKKESVEALKYLRQIIFQGRQAGVFLVMATQKPDADAIPTAIRDQAGLRVALGSLSDEGYRMVFGSRPGFDYKSCGCGAGYIFMDGSGFSMPQKFESPFIPNLELLVDKMRELPLNQ